MARAGLGHALALPLAVEPDEAELLRPVVDRRLEPRPRAGGDVIDGDDSPADGLDLLGGVTTLALHMAALRTRRAPTPRPRVVHRPVPRLPASHQRRSDRNAASSRAASSKAACIDESLTDGRRTTAVLTADRGVHGHRPWGEADRQRGAADPRRGLQLDPACVARRPQRRLDRHGRLPRPANRPGDAVREVEGAVARAGAFQRQPLPRPAPLPAALTRY